MPHKDVLFDILIVLSTLVSMSKPSCSIDFFRYEVIVVVVRLYVLYEEQSYSVDGMFA